jgi:hypothetical protein
MSSHSEPDENETAVRNALLKLGARPTGHAPLDGAEQQAAPTAPHRPDPAAVVVPPRPENPPTDGVPRPGRVSQPRVPDWWAPDKPTLTGDDEQPDTDDQADDADGQPADDTDDAEQAPSRGRRLLTILNGQPSDGDETGGRPRLRRTSKEPIPDLGEEAGEYDDEIRPAGEGRGHRRSTGPSRRPKISTPLFPRDRERKSLIEAWGEVKPRTKSALYHLTGLAGGLAFGVVGYATEATRSVAESPLPLRENPDAYFWGASAVLVLAVDRATRRWSLVVHWVTRALTTSLLVGAVLHGNTVGEALANMPTILDQLSNQR